VGYDGEGCTTPDVPADEARYEHLGTCERLTLYFAVPAQEMDLPGSSITVPWHPDRDAANLRNALPPED
jgi:hypothetical protein